MRCSRLAPCALAIVTLALVVPAASAFPTWVGGLPEFGAQPLVTKASVIETTSKHKIICPSHEGLWEVGTGQGMRYVAILFTCTMNREPCYLRGGQGTILLEFSGNLVYLNKERHKVGVQLSLTRGEEEIVCGNVHIERVRGGLTATVGPVNKIVIPPAHFTLTLRQKEGLQIPSGFEGTESWSLLGEFDGQGETGVGFSTTLIAPFQTEKEIAA